MNSSIKTRIPDTRVPSKGGVLGALAVFNTKRLVFPTCCPSSFGAVVATYPFGPVGYPQYLEDYLNNELAGWDSYRRWERTGAIKYLDASAGTRTTETIYSWYETVDYSYSGGALIASGADVLDTLKENEWALPGDPTPYTCSSTMSGNSTEDDVHATYSWKISDKDSMFAENASKTECSNSLASELTDAVTKEWLVGKIGDWVDGDAALSGTPSTPDERILIGYFGEWSGGMLFKAMLGKVKLGAKKADHVSAITLSYDIVYRQNNAVLYDYEGNQLSGVTPLMYQGTTVYSELITEHFVDEFGTYAIGEWKFADIPWQTHLDNRNLMSVPTHEYHAAQYKVRIRRFDPETNYRLVLSKNPSGGGEAKKASLDFVNGETEAFQFDGDGNAYGLVVHVEYDRDDETITLPKSEWRVFYKARTGEEWGYASLYAATESWENPHYRVRQYTVNAQTYATDPSRGTKRGESSISGSAQTVYSQSWDADAHTEGEWSVVSRTGSVEGRAFKIDDLNWNGTWISATTQRWTASPASTEAYGIAFSDAPCEFGTENSRTSHAVICDNEEGEWLMSDELKFAPGSSELGYSLSPGECAYIENIKINAVA
jgi:hypothetical protein